MGSLTAMPAAQRNPDAISALVLDPVRLDRRDFKQMGELDPSLIRTPTLLIYGDRDPQATTANLLSFIERNA